jgi:TonB family protein
MRRIGVLVVAAVLAAGVFTWTNRAQAESHAGRRRAVDKVAPVYPELARRNRIRGVVKVEVVVRENGSVKSTKVLGGSPLLIDSAADAVRKWKFEPASQETTEVVQVEFAE